MSCEKKGHTYYEGYGCEDCYFEDLEKSKRDDMDQVCVHPCNECREMVQCIATDTPSKNEHRNVDEKRELHACPKPDGDGGRFKPACTIVK